MRKTIVFICFAIVFGLLAGPASAEQETTGPDAKDTIGRTPPRLSLTEGQVSFWRPGDEDWTRAQINTALAPGDQLFAGPGSRMEIQVSGQTFVRGGADTQIGLESQEPDFIQFKVTSGQASLDVRSIAPGRMVEVDTPNAAFTIDSQGYYRLDVDEERTVFISRRAGWATATTADGDKIAIGAHTALTVEGSDNPIILSQTAPPLDALDQWSYARTDRILEDRASARYVSSGICGIADLDRYGTWRIVPTYGEVWVPDDVGADWVPYSTGSWMYDAYYGWTWVDTAPWGWAPYHYGRWVHVGGRWCWAPGPRIVRPVYAPALVAFYGEPGVQIGIGVGGPFVGWVALGWGEPLIPWWGRPGFIHRPWWGGWGGPHCVNGKIVHRRTIVNVAGIKKYHNARVRNAIVVITKDRFGHGPVTHARIIRTDIRHLRPVHAAPRIAATPASLVPTPHRGLRPPETHLNRTVVNAGRPHPRRPGSGHDGARAYSISPRQQHPVSPYTFRGGHENDLHNRPSNFTHPPAAHQQRQESEQRRDLLPSFRRPPVTRPQTPAHVNRPAAPRTFRPPAAPMKPDTFRPPGHIAPRTPRAVHKGRDKRPQVSSPPNGGRVHSGGSVGRGRGSATLPPAVHTRPQVPHRGLAPKADKPHPKARQSNRSHGAVPNAFRRQDRHARSLNKNSDPPGPPPRYGRSAPQVRQGGGGRSHPTSRHGRRF